MPKVELEGCIFRRGYAEEGVAWLGGGILLTGRCGGAVRVVPHSLPESPYSLPDSLLSSIYTLSSIYINNGHI